MDSIQMNLFEYFYDNDEFTVQQATHLVKDIKNKKVNNESS